MLNAANFTVKKLLQVDYKQINKADYGISFCFSGKEYKKRKKRDNNIVMVMQAFAFQNCRNRSRLFSKKIVNFKLDSEVV